jgi:hypothetical protein
MDEARSTALSIGLIDESHRRKTPRALELTGTRDLDLELGWWRYSAGRSGRQGEPQLLDQRGSNLIWDSVSLLFQSRLIHKIRFRYSLLDLEIILLGEIANMDLILVVVPSCCVLKSFTFDPVDLNSSIFLDCSEISIVKLLWIVIENYEVFDGNNAELWIVAYGLHVTFSYLDLWLLFASN